MQPQRAIFIKGFFFLVVLQISKSAVHLIVSILTYGAGVVYNKIRVLISSFHVAYLLEYSDKFF